MNKLIYESGKTYNEDSSENKNMYQNVEVNSFENKNMYHNVEINSFENKKVNSITKEERHKLVKLLKNFNVVVEGFRPVEEAIVTAGGVSTKEINPKTMESKIVKGLYFAGEIIDVDAYTGGFNLQIAYSTGYTAGMDI